MIGESERKEKVIEIFFQINAIGKREERERFFILKREKYTLPYRSTTSFALHMTFNL
jgi:hypothetical protein